MQQNLFFCEKCNLLTDGGVCRQCGGKTRVPLQSDLCFFAEFGWQSYRMFSEALTSAEIDYVAEPVYGGFSRLNKPVGYRFYVKYADYAATQEVYDTLFACKAQPQNDDCNPTSVIDRAVKVIVERPKGSVHPEHRDIKYQLNYGHVEGVTGGDGEEQDAYIVGVNAPLQRLSEFYGYVIAVIVRKNDVETKWVVAPVYGGISPRTPKYTKEQIAAAVNFQEKFFDIEIIM